MPEYKEGTAAGHAVSSDDGNGRLLSIREVSALTGVPSHTLRFWEKEMPAVLKPVRTPGGQRRYDSAVVERIRAIRRLSVEERFPLAVIRERLGSDQGSAERSPDQAARLDAERLAVERIAIERLVDEVADLLKERLLGFLGSGSLPQDHNGS